VDPWAEPGVVSLISTVPCSIICELFHCYISVFVTFDSEKGESICLSSYVAVGGFLFDLVLHFYGKIATVVYSKYTVVIMMHLEINKSNQY